MLRIEIRYADKSIEVETDEITDHSEQLDVLRMVLDVEPERALTPTEINYITNMRIYATGLQNQIQNVINSDEEYSSLDPTLLSQFDDALNDLILIDEKFNG